MENQINERPDFDPAFLILSGNDLHLKKINIEPAGNIPAIYRRNEANHLA